MFKLILALGATGLLLGCGGGNGFDKILKKGREFKDKTCACKDVACLEGVEKEMEAWFEKAAKDFKGEPSKAQDEAWDKIEAEAEACSDKIKDAERAKEATAALATLKQLVDRTCACTDKACTDKVQEEMTAAMTKVMTAEPTPEQQKEVDGAIEKISTCMAKVLIPADPALVDPNAPAAPADPAAPAAPADPAAPPPAAPPAN